MAQFHSIEIKVPVPEKDVRGANRVMESYGDELDALIAKLPEGSQHRNWISNERAEMTKPRKTKAESIAEAVAAAREEDRKAREAAATANGGTPPGGGGRRQQQHTEAAQ